MATKKTRSVPLHLQVRDRILAMIPKMQVGDVLPHERNLAEELGVSRITVRNAYARLVESGHVVRTHKAYRVAPHRLSSGLFMLEGFTRDAMARGLGPRTEVLGVELVYPEPAIAQSLMLKPDQRTYRLHRRRYLRDKLVGIEHTSVSERLAPGLDRDKLGTLYKVLERRYELRVHWARQWFNFVLGESDQREKLGLPESVPMLHLERISLTEKNLPIEHVHAFYDMREMEFYIELRR